MTVTPQLLLIEGLAAQLYAKEREGDGYPWWHLLREEIRVEYRAKAAEHLAQGIVAAGSLFAR